MDKSKQKPTTFTCHHGKGTVSDDGNKCTNRGKKNICVSGGHPCKRTK